MRVLLVATILAISLSGCSSGPGLSGMLILPSDLPADCGYVNLSSDKGQEVPDEVQWHSNPGPIKNKTWVNDFAEGADEVYVAWFECEGEESEVFSIAARFSSQNATQEFIEDECDGSMVVSGQRVSFFDLDGDVASLSLAQNITANIVARTGGTQPCPVFE